MADGPAVLTLDDDNPWPGPDSYTEAAQRYFYGRDLDSVELLRLIRLSPFVVLYGKSGLGKTSMVQAGVFPRLRAARFLPVYLRLDYTESAETPPLQQAFARLRQEIADAGADAAPVEPGEGLWAYLQRRERPIWTSDNFPLTPVLVFDQFEEVFSRGGSPEHVARVLGDIADLVGDRFTTELAEDRDAARRLTLQSQQYRVVLSFRSDFLAEVETWERQANLPKHEALHLKALTRGTAIDAVERAGAAVLEPGVAPSIVDFVLARDDSGAQDHATDVEPVLLSLCCYQLNCRRKRPAKIDAALLKSVGKDILLDFYNGALAGIAPRVSVFIEDNLIQGGRYRSSFPHQEAIASGALTADDLTLLTSRRLLRVDPQCDVPRIELIHDRLVGIVREAKDARLQRERERREQLGLDLELMQRLDRLGYEVEERVGEGDFGIVYRATHVAEGRKVALKIVRCARQGSTDTDRPNRESYVRVAELVGRLGHESIVGVSEACNEAGHAVFVMEWVEGLPITVALKGADWDAKVRTLELACAAIALAHEQGVIHGDLKPNNLLVGRDLKPRVLDFGLIRLRAQSGDLQRGASGAAGTVRYIAPEQILGGAAAGQAADIYALGVVLYELLTGEPPFAADHFHSVLDAQLHDAPELPMLKREDVPEPLQRICLKALEKSPQDRYRSMSAMREDLERYRSGKPVSVRPTYYNNLIETPARAHVGAIDRWHEQALITGGEHVKLHRAYQSLTQSGLQAVSESRLVHPLVVLLYMGGFLLLDGAACWLVLYYMDVNREMLGLVNRRTVRVLVSLVPALVTNGLWQFLIRRGSYRFAFAAMILGLLSLPFAVGITVHEIVDGLDIAALKNPLVWGPKDKQLFDATLPNWQLFVALLVPLCWGAYVAFQSQTLTSATIVGAYFVLLYLIGLDFYGLKYLLSDRISSGGLCMLPAAGALVAAGVYAVRNLKRPRQAAPLFAIAMVVAILASQAIAIYGPDDWGWPRAKSTEAQYLGIGVIEVELGIVCLIFALYLRHRFRLEAAVASVVLSWLAPLAFLTGIALMDIGWAAEGLDTFTFLGRSLTPWLPILLACSMVVGFLAARLQSYLYVICGLCFLDYSLFRIVFLEPKHTPWLLPFAILCAGIAVMGCLTWWDVRKRVGEDIDDVAERLIRRSPPERVERSRWWRRNRQSSSVNADPPALNGPFARVGFVLGAYVFGGVLALTAGATNTLLTSMAIPGSSSGTEQGVTVSWLLMRASWMAVAALGAYLVTIVGGRRAVVLGVATALGALSALFVPLLVHGFPLRVFAELWFEALMLGVCLPVAVYALWRWA